MNKSYNATPEDIEARMKAKAKKRDIERMRIAEMLEEECDEFDIPHNMMNKINKAVKGKRV